MSLSFYEELFVSFAQYEVKYLVVGGMAVNFYGYVRLTVDVDIMVDFTEENLSKLINVMTKLGYVPRVPVKAEELKDQKKRYEWIKNKGALVFTFIKPDEPIKHLDVFLNNPIDFNDAYQRRKDFKLGNICVSVASLDDIIYMKKEAARPRDVEDIQHLQSIKEYIDKKKES